jgi:hypothetical protein
MIHDCSFVYYICYIYTSLTSYLDHIGSMRHARLRAEQPCTTYDPCMILQLLHLFLLRNFLHLSWIISAPQPFCTAPDMCRGSYMIHDCSTRSLAHLMDHILSMTALHGAFMSHGSYMIHKCSTRSLTRIMDPI